MFEGSEIEGAEKEKEESEKKLVEEEEAELEPILKEEGTTREEAPAEFRASVSYTHLTLPTIYSV